MSRVFIAGCGYVGERLAAYYKKSACEVVCMVRTPEHAEKLAAEGYQVLLCSLDSREDVPQFDLSDSVLFYLVPPPGGGIADSRVRNFVENISAAGRPQKIVYMSATSVYGGSDGGAVTEKSLAAPDSAMGKRRLDAENLFSTFAEATGSSLSILRVSGIYGPGRLPLMQISHHQPLLNESESGPSNRIQIEDLIAVSVAAAEKYDGVEIYNVSDGSPCSMTTYFNACADALGFPRQPQVSLTEAYSVMSPLMLSYVTQSKIVDNRKMLDRLGISLLYPSLSEGLAASL